MSDAPIFIKKKEPFFLYFPLTAPHKPVQPHPRFIGKSKLGLYGDFVMQVDWTVGQVMRAIRSTLHHTMHALLFPILKFLRCWHSTKRAAI